MKYLFHQNDHVSLLPKKPALCLHWVKRTRKELKIGNDVIVIQALVNKIYIKTSVAILGSPYDVYTYCFCYDRLCNKHIPQKIFHNNFIIG